MEGDWRAIEKRKEHEEDGEPSPESRGSKEKEEKDKGRSAQAASSIKEDEDGGATQQLGGIQGEQEDDNGIPTKKSRGRKRKKEEERGEDEEEPKKKSRVSKRSKEGDEEGPAQVVLPSSSGARMAGLGEDSSPPAQDSLDPSCPDIKLLLGRQEEGVHEVTVNREALAGLSPVFKSMLTHDMAEKKQGTVRLETVSLEAWEVISDFYFSQKDKFALYFSPPKRVTLDNVQEMVSLADMYQLTDLKDHCDDYLCKKTDAFENFSDLFSWATTYRLRNLKRKLLKMVRGDFAHFSESECFLRLSKEDLLTILSGPYIVGSEDTVCLAVLRWLQDQNADSEMVKQIFGQLKLNEVCVSCLERHVSGSQYAALADVIFPFIEKEKQERERKSLDQLPMQWFAQKSYGRVFLQPPDKNARPFGLSCKCEGEKRDHRMHFQHPGNTVFVYQYTCLGFGWDLEKQREVQWEIERADIKYPACFFENFLVITGDHERRQVHFYDLEAKVWLPPSFLRRQRQSHAMVAVGDALYVVMGEGRTGNLASLEMFRSDARKWVRAGHMQRATTNVAAAAVGNLIIASGSSGYEKIYQSFNTETQAAAILLQDMFGLQHQWAFSLGSRGVLFAQEGAIICICLQDGEVTCREERCPEIQEAFDTDWFNGPDVQCTAGKGKGGLQQLSLRNWENTVYSVQFSLGGKRANLVPLPVSINGRINSIIIS